jgi:DNA-binding winged helix-turn-helix (wHTH) protein
MTDDTRIVRFDWNRDCVMRGTLAARISGQEKALLRAIVERAGALCAREQLMDTIWAGRVAYVDELYLTQLIYRLRKSLRPLGLADAIVTVPRAGYCFVADGLQCEYVEYATYPWSQPQPPHRAALGWVARIRVAWRALRRTHEHGSGESERLPVVEIEANRVSCGGVTVCLTALEQVLLAALVESPSATLDREALIARIWGKGSPVDASRLIKLVSRLRRSLQPLGLDQRLTYVPSRGYRFHCETFGDAGRAPAPGAPQPLHEDANGTQCRMPVQVRTSVSQAREVQHTTDG